MSRVSVIGYRFVSDGAFSEKQRELILADPRVREVRPGPGGRRSLDNINNHGGDERDDRAGDQGRDPEQGGGSYIDISTLSTLSTLSTGGPGGGGARPGENHLQRQCVPRLRGGGRREAHG